MGLTSPGVAPPNQNWSYDEWQLPDSSFYKPHPGTAQEAFFYDNVHRYVWLSAGRGAGKTTAGAVAVIDDMTNPDLFPCPYLVVAPTYDLMRDVTFRRLWALLPEWYKTRPRAERARFQLNNNEKKLWIPCYDENGQFLGMNEAILRSASDPQSTLIGHSVKRVWIDECGKLKDSFAFFNCDMCLREGSFAEQRFIMTGTPDEEWIETLFEEGEPEVFARYFMETRENLALDPRLRDQMYSHRGLVAERELSGRYVPLSGKAFPGLRDEIHFAEPPWSEVPEPEEGLPLGPVIHVPMRFQLVFAGVDFGEAAPSAVEVVGYRDRRSYVLDEYYMPHSSLEDVYQACRLFVADYRVTRFFADPSGYKGETPGAVYSLRIQYLLERGLHVEKGSKDQKARVNLINSLLRVDEDGFPYLVISANCPNLRREMKSWGYETKAQDYFSVQDLPLRLRDGGDHGIDAAGMALVPLSFGRSSRRAPLQEVWA